MKTLSLFKKLNAFVILSVLSVFVFTILRCTPPPNENPVDDSYKKKLISHEDAQVLFDEYTKTNHQVLTDSRKGNPDSRWYSFTIEEMEGYIKYVKENAEKQNIKNVGIKIYMGKYPINHPKDKMSKPEYAGYQTIFLMPTTKRQESTNETMKRSVGTEQDVKIESIQPMNMTNLAPPPKAVVEAIN